MLHRTICPLIIALLAVLVGGCGEDAPPATPAAPDNADAGQTDAEPAADSRSEAQGGEAPERASLAKRDGQFEYWGRLHGERFWVRLLPRSADHGDLRILLLEYHQPPQDQLDGTLLTDHPVLLVDDVLRLRLWDSGSHSLSTARYRQGGEPRYETVHERERKEDNDYIPYTVERTIHARSAWDLRLAPILLPMLWQPGTRSPAIPVVDLFGPRHDERMTLRWQDRTVELAGARYTIVPDAEGRFQRLVDAAGETVVSIEGRAPDLTPGEADDRARASAERLEAFLEQSDAATVVPLPIEGFAPPAEIPIDPDTAAVRQNEIAPPDATTPEQPERDPGPSAPDQPASDQQTPDPQQPDPSAE